MFPANTKILVVDDMSMMRTIVTGELKKLGYSNVIKVADGLKAFQELEAAKAAQSPVELILSDWNMPVMQGIELLRKIRSTPDFQTLPFIFITAEGEVGQIKEAASLGVNAYLMKPFTPVSLTEKLTVVWNQIQKKQAA
jgi:two-component system chemotaxis response regulator CheY